METIRNNEETSPVKKQERRDQGMSFGERFLNTARRLNQEVEPGSAESNYFHVQMTTGNELVFLAHALAFEVISALRRTEGSVLQISGRALDLLEAWCEENGYEFNAAISENELPGSQKTNGHLGIEFVPFDASNGHVNIEDAMGLSQKAVTVPKPTYSSRRHGDLRRNGIDLP